MNDLREKIARALIEDVYPELRDAWGSLTDAHKAGYLKRADAVLAVLDLDKVRAEAWDEGAEAARGEDFMAADFTPTENPYRRAGR